MRNKVGKFEIVEKCICEIEIEIVVIIEFYVEKIVIEIDLK